MQTHNNHLTFGYHGKDYVFRQNATDKWFVRYGTVKEKPLSFGDEAVRAARLISSAYAGKDLYLFYSGGADSEFMVRSFQKAGVPFKIAIIRFADELNLHDITFATKYCREAGLNPVYLDIDIYNFFHSGQAESYAQRSQTHTPALLHHLWAIDQIDGVPILATGENYWYKSEIYNPASSWHFWDEEMFFGIQRFLSLDNRDGVPAFFKFTPELVLSSLLLNDIQQLINNKLNPKWFDSEAIKHAQYRNVFSDMQTLPIPGYTGFERLFMLFGEYVYRLKQEDGLAIQKLSEQDVLAQLGIN